MNNPGEHARLGEIAEIVKRVLPWCGSPTPPCAWYRLRPLSAVADQTAAVLVRQRLAGWSSSASGIAHTHGGFAGDQPLTGLAEGWQRRSCLTVEIGRERTI